MNNYYFNLTKEETENILDKHKSLYDGYAINNKSSNMQPLYTQDFANDKKGVTINSLGEISDYNNTIYMKESKKECSKCGLCEEECKCALEEAKANLEALTEMINPRVKESNFKTNVQESLDMFQRFKKFK